MEQDGKRQQIVFVNSTRIGKEQLADNQEMPGRTDWKKLADSLDDRHNDDFDNIDGIH